MSQTEGDSQAQSAPVPGRPPLGLPKHPHAWMADFYLSSNSQHFRLGTFNRHSFCLISFNDVRVKKKSPYSALALKPRPLSVQR